MQPHGLLIFVVGATLTACSLVSATKGVDVSAATSIDAFSCLAQNSYQFGAVRAYQKQGAPDPNAVYSVINAWDGGIRSVDIYLDPCPTCGNPEIQVEDTIYDLIINEVPFITLWLTVDDALAWQTNVTVNRAFFELLISTARDFFGVPVGVYTSASQWNTIMGADYQFASSLPLWYVHYDGKASFSDFAQFGGWTTPTAKRYQANSKICGVNVNLDWRS